MFQAGKRAKMLKIGKKKKNRNNNKNPCTHHQWEGKPLESARQESWLREGEELALTS